MTAFDISGLFLIIICISLHSFTLDTGHRQKAIFWFFLFTFALCYENVTQVLLISEFHVSERPRETD